MLFDSPAYFLFLIPVVLLYWRLNHRTQNIFLLLASYLFYGWWDWRFLALMIGSTTVDFLVAQRIAPSRSDSHRRNWLTSWTSIKGGSSLPSLSLIMASSSACSLT